VSATKSFAFFLLPFLMAAVVASAAADWPQISPEEQSMTSVPEQPGAPAVILLRQENDDDNLHYHGVYTRIKVLTEAGRKYADVELPYNRRGFVIDQVSGRTVHADGTVVPFEGKPFDKVVLKGHNLRIQVKTFSLPDVQVGSILDYRYSLRYDDNSLQSPEWMIQSEIPEKKVSFKFIPFQTKGNRYIIVDHGRTASGVAWTPYLPVGHEPKLQTGPTGATWVELQMENVMPMVDEPFMLPSNPLRWRVQFYYQVELKSDEYWKQEGKFWNKDVESFLNRDKGLREAVAQTVAASDPPEAKLRKIYAFVSQLENQSYTPRRTEQEEQTLGVKFNAGVEDVLRQRSGYHDQLNRLFVAMARAAGLQASMMWVADRSENLFEPQFLSTNQLDAEIVVVQLDGKDMFLDPGTKYAPYGFLNWHYLGTQGLRQNRDKGADIASSPSPSYKQATLQRVANLTLSEQGTFEGTIAVGFDGLEAMSRRQEGNKTDAEGRKKMLQDEVRSWLPGGSEVALINEPIWDKTIDVLVARFKVSGPLALGAGKRWIVPVHVFEVNDKPRFSAAQRIGAICFDYPSREIDEVHITLPPNLEVESLPPHEEVKLSYALYVADQKPEGPHGIVATRDLAMADFAFPSPEYKDLKGFYDKVKAADDQPLVLRSPAHAQGN
jgi:hypothetical protein